MIKYKHILERKEVMPKNYHPLVKKVLFDYDQISKETKKVAQKLNEYYSKLPRNEEVIIIGILKGSIPFFSLLLKDITFENQIDFCKISSFKGKQEAQGDPELEIDITSDIKGKHLLLIEDIIDSGLTIEILRNHYLKMGAKSVKIASLLDKKSGRKTNIDPDFYAFDIEGLFVVGFGLDYEERLRNLPYVAVCDVDKLKD